MLLISVFFRITHPRANTFAERHPPPCGGNMYTCQKEMRVPTPRMRRSSLGYTVARAARDIVSTPEKGRSDGIFFFVIGAIEKSRVSIVQKKEPEALGKHLDLRVCRVVPLRSQRPIVETDTQNEVNILAGNLECCQLVSCEANRQQAFQGRVGPKQTPRPLPTAVRVATSCCAPLMSLLLLFLLKRKRSNRCCIWETALYCCCQFVTYGIASIELMLLQLYSGGSTYSSSGY